ncbi:hypothetical protein SAMN04487972_1721 [Paracoccus halophilus]|uniref:Uncharacterized protein n=1 Tax=Paracoccus halophilus TaxID=376733 RepID=A0A1I0UG56_9RHOB|nr:hypothetical protein SAMN04487972_1721 [Paracoccus halophilus]
MLARAGPVTGASKRDLVSRIGLAIEGNPFDIDAAMTDDSLHDEELNAWVHAGEPCGFALGNLTRAVHGDRRTIALNHPELGGVPNTAPDCSREHVGPPHQGGSLDADHSDTGVLFPCRFICPPSTASGMPLNRTDAWPGFKTGPRPWIGQVCMCPTSAIGRAMISPACCCISAVRASAGRLYVNLPSAGPCPCQLLNFFNQNKDRQRRVAGRSLNLITDRTVLGLDLEADT